MQQHVSPILLMTATLVVGSTACSDYSASDDVVSKLEYAKHFEQTFGEVADDQDWSMAATLLANARIDMTGSAQAFLYSADPLRRAASHYYGHIELANGIGSGIFTLPKGLGDVYVQVIQGSDCILSGYCTINSGRLDITEASMKATPTATRTEGALSVGELVYTHQAWDAELTWDGLKYYLHTYNQKEQIYLAKEGGEWYFYYNPDVTVDANTFRKLAHNASGTDINVCGYKTDWGKIYYADNGEEAISNLDLGNYIDYDSETGVATFKEESVGSNRVMNRRRYDARYYTINGDTQTDDIEWTIGDCKTLFWTGDPVAFFQEGIDYRSDGKKSLYTGQGVTLNDLEAGVVYTTKTDGSEINIPMMYGATQYSNILGYYYYTDGQDPREVNRYILYEDAQPTTNIKVDGKALTNGMDLQMLQPGWTDESVVTCTVRRLVYFGVEGNEAGTYQFPAGVHIGFFIRRQPATGTYDPNTVSETGWAYSDPSLNELYFYDTNGVNETRQQFWGYRGSNDGSIDADKTRGNVKAITWKYNNRILVGFGDDSGDCDLNDFVFWVDGDFEETPKIVITTTETYSNSWLFASEDLGGTYDYDFNDVVWDVHQDVTQRTTDGVTATTYGDIEIRLLAAGGTLPAALTYDGETISAEIHQTFGQAPAETYQPVNVGGSISKRPVVVKTITASSAMVLSNYSDKFAVVVKDHGASHIVSTDVKALTATSKAPQVLVLTGEWEWPTELTPITTAYPDFKEWVKDTSWTTWSSHKQGPTTRRN